MRRECPSAWHLLLAECRAGLRRYTGTDLGENYGRILAHGGEGDYSDPDPAQRTLGDYIDPSRAGTVTELVNVVSREVGDDVKAWRWDRLLNMVGMMRREARQRERQSAPSLE